jgi:hypothetical protein
MMPDSSAGGLPLSALLSQALVAFTIEFDNEAERRIPHRTTNHGGTRGGVWLVSMAMWLNCMRYASADPVSVAELRLLARSDTNLDGMRRWGYITLTPEPASGRRKGGDAGLLVQATARGLRAKEAWQPLTATIEQRWQERYGAELIGQLTSSLQAIAGQLGYWLPDCLPILGYGLFSRDKKPGEDRYEALRAWYERQPPDRVRAEPLALPWLLARVLLSLALDFERESAVSLAIAHNALRVIGSDGTRVRDLPGLTGVSTEGLAMATGYLEREGLATLGTDPAGGKWKLVRLTPSGVRAAIASDGLLTSIADRWHARYGAATMNALRGALEALAIGANGAVPPLFAAIEPYPDGWRASVRRPVTLPYYPMVLHRGGYPDGS